MDYTKIDAALAAALQAPGPRASDSGWDVSVRVNGTLDADQQLRLAQLGVRGVRPDRTVFSARASHDNLQSLTDLPCVRLVSLAQSLRPLSR